jgi:hypothetical protein
MEIKYLLFPTIFSCLASKIIDVRNYANTFVPSVLYPLHCGLFLHCFRFYSEHLLFA